MENIIFNFDKKHEIVKFLIHRTNSKPVLLDYCSNLSIQSVQHVLAYLEPTNKKENQFKFDNWCLSHRLDEFAFLFTILCENGLIPTSNHASDNHNIIHAGCTNRNNNVSQFED